MSSSPSCREHPRDGTSSRGRRKGGYGEREGERSVAAAVMLQQRRQGDMQRQGQGQRQLLGTSCRPAPVHLATISLSLSCLSRNFKFLGGAAVKRAALPTAPRYFY